MGLWSEVIETFKKNLVVDRVSSSSFAAIEEKFPPGVWSLELQQSVNTYGKYSLSYPRAEKKYKVQALGCHASVHCQRMSLT